MREITIPAVISQIPEVTTVIDTYLEELECPMKVQVQIDVAIDEILSNIANYAYGDETGEATVTIDTLEGSVGVAITFKDSGSEYNPLDKEDPDITLSAEEREIGGLGIYLVKKTMDSVEYEYKDGYNILTLHKNF